MPEMVLSRFAVLVRWSKSCLYETPCHITGMTKLAGLEDSPKSVYAKIKPSERGKLAMWRPYMPMKR